MKNCVSQPVFYEELTVAAGFTVNGYCVYSGNPGL